MRLYFIVVTAICSVLFAEPKVLYHIDFTKLPAGDAKKVLVKRGYEFLLDADAFTMTTGKEGVVVETDKRAAVLWGRRFADNPLKNVGSIKIVWGVKRFPKGADWERGKNRLALGAIIVLGKEMFSAGVPFAPDAPYFLGPFIGEKERPGKVYFGKLYKKNGRYYCVGNTTGEMVTHFDIDGMFKKAFAKPTPPLVALAFQTNTKNTSGGAEAFVKSVTIYSK